MASPGPREILEDLNSKSKYNYLHVPRSEKHDKIRVNISRSGSESVLSNPQHQIKGTIHAIHTLYLAIENYLRVESKLSESADVFRVSDDKYNERLYRVPAKTKTQMDGWSHWDDDLDKCRENKSLNGNQIAALLKENSTSIQKYAKEKLGGVHEYRGISTSEIQMSVRINGMEGETFRVQTSYRKKDKKFETDVNYTDVNYTHRELISLRFALLDFLRYHVGAFYEFRIARYIPGRKTPKFIFSRIQVYVGGPELLTAK
jgi:hypothetical protein